MHFEKPPYTSPKEAKENPEIRKVYDVVEGKIKVVESKLEEAKEQIIKLENVMEKIKQGMIKVKNMGARIIAEGANFKGIKVSDEEKETTRQNVLETEAKYEGVLQRITKLANEILVEPIENSNSDFDKRFDEMILPDSKAKEESKRNEEELKKQTMNISEGKESDETVIEKIQGLLNKLDNLENFSLKALALEEEANQSVKSSDEAINIKLSVKEREIEKGKKDVNEQARTIIGEIGKIMTSVPETIKATVQKEIFNWRINQEIKDLKKEKEKITETIQQIRREVAEKSDALALELKQVNKPTVGEVSRKQSAINRRAGELSPLVKQSMDIQQQIKQLEVKLKK